MSWDNHIYLMQTVRASHAIITCTQIRLFSFSVWIERLFILWNHARECTSACDHSFRNESQLYNISILLLRTRKRKGKRDRIVDNIVSGVIHNALLNFSIWKVHTPVLTCMWSTISLRQYYTVDNSNLLCSIEKRLIKSTKWFLRFTSSGKSDRENGIELIPFHWIATK